MSQKNVDSMFQVWVYTKGAQHDDIIRKIAKVEEFGSGVGPQGRDLSFFVANEQDALKMKSRMMRYKCVNKVEVVYPNGRRIFLKGKKNAGKSFWMTFD